MIESDDVVIRLRAAAHDERLSTGVLYLEAADQIEWLSLELKHALAKLDVAMASPPFSKWQVAMKSPPRSRKRRH